MIPLLQSETLQQSEAFLFWVLVAYCFTLLSWEIFSDVKLSRTQQVALAGWPASIVRQAHSPGKGLGASQPALRKVINCCDTTILMSSIVASEVGHDFSEQERFDNPKDTQ